MKRWFFKIQLLAVFIIFGTVWLMGAEGQNSFKMPDYEKIVLENGMTVYLLEQREVPLIYMSLVFPAGAVYDGVKSGLASLTAEGLLFGTGTYSKKEIEESLDFIGARISTSASQEFSHISVSFAQKDLNTVLPILKSVVHDPVFDNSEFEKRQKRLVLDLERAKESPSGVIQSYFNKFLYGEHVYGNPVSGTIKSVSGLSAKDLKDFYKTYYIPGRSAMAVAGDFETSAMKQTIAETFNDWITGEITAIPALQPVQPFGDSRILLVNKDDATETQFLIGNLGIKRSNPDYIAIQVINTILGGRFTSWLNDELRVNRGLTYGARSHFSTFRHSGTFVVRSFTQTKTTIEAIDVSLEILDRLHTKGIDEETLASAKNYIKGLYPLRYETAGQLADLLTDMFCYEFDESFINDFQKNVDGMDVEKANYIIGKYFPRENLQFVLIGKADDLREQVGKYGKLWEKEIK
ncbi:insulinase family protein, partial [candidate division KSB1 bacterium]|nr:insulinase family protein [candidate division KSB1 bacterium]